MKTFVDCKCGKRITSIAELGNVRSLGLALKGDCPKCGSRVGCGELWVCAFRGTYEPGRTFDVDTKKRDFAPRPTQKNYNVGQKKGGRRRVKVVKNSETYLRAS